MPPRRAPLDCEEEEEEPRAPVQQRQRQQLVRRRRSNDRARRPSSSAVNEQMEIRAEPMTGLMEHEILQEMRASMGGRPSAITTVDGIQHHNGNPILYRVWCHHCESYTCASTIDDLPPSCPMCDEEEYLELVPMQNTVTEHGLFTLRNGPIWSEHARRMTNDPVAREDIELLGEPAFQQFIQSMIARAMEGRGADGINFFELDERRFERPLSEAAQRGQLRRFKNNDSKNKESKDCSVCLEKMKKGEQMTELKKCGHQFHTSCVDEWFKTKNTCPVCRFELEVEEDEEQCEDCGLLRPAQRRRL